MRKALSGALLLLVCLGAAAQENTGYVAILPGYQFPSGSQTRTFTPLTAKLTQNDGWLASLDFGWFFTDRVGLHAGYIYLPDHYKLHLWNGATDLGTSTLNQSASLLEVGPEFLLGRWGDTGQAYAQLNAGYAFGGGDTTFNYGGNPYTMNRTGDGDWAAGAALGYRHYFNEVVGWTLQGAYHHVHNWPADNFWDVRTGVSFRFPKVAPPPQARAVPPPPPPAPPQAVAPPRTPTPAPPPPPPPPPPAPPEAPKTIAITLDESVLHFDTNKWAIPKAAHATLDAVVQKLNEAPLRINISGHTDSRGSAAWNAVLSKNRAESVRQYLVTHGIDPGRIASVTGEGPARPVADNGTKEGRSKNRRVEIVSVAPVEVPVK